MSLTGGLIVFAVSVCAIFLLGELIVLLCVWRGSMTDWMFDGSGASGEKLLCFPVWLALTMFVIVFSFIGYQATFSNIKHYRNGVRRKN